MKVERTLTVTDVHGFHMRSSYMFVRAALEFDDVTVRVRRHSLTADGTSMRELMSLGAGPGSEILVEVEGPHAEQVMDALTTIVAHDFGLPAWTIR